MMDFDVVVDVSLSGAVDGDGLRQLAPGSRESCSNITLASEPTDGQTGQFEGGVSVHLPVFAVQEFPVGGQFVHQAKARPNVGANLARDVQPRPVGFTGEVEHDGDVVIDDEVKMANGDVARGDGLHVDGITGCVGLEGPC